MPLKRASLSSSSMKSGSSVESYERSPSMGWGRIQILEKSPRLPNQPRVSSMGNLSSHGSIHSGEGDKSPMLGGYRPGRVILSECNAGEMSPMLRDNRYSYGGVCVGGSAKQVLLPPLDGSRSPGKLGPSSPLALADKSMSNIEYEKESPPLIKWIFPALACALSYALYNIFIKMGSANIHPVLGGVILQFVAAILGTVLILILIWKEGTEELFFERSGIKFASLAGVMVGLAEIISFVVSGMGVQAVQSIPIIIGGCIMFGSVLGVLMLKEELTPQGWLGVAVLIVGISLVATDPGDKVEAA